ncbi:MAG: response regulator [Anaerolineales bacterium]|nr:response regulator [Anaerolineales bacterium]
MDAVNVLVVDDDPAFADLMAMHLRKKGHKVQVAYDGYEAVQSLRSDGPFEVLVTDLMMPGLSGLELLRSAQKIDPLLEVVVITASGSLEMAISALREDGAYDYLTKPLELFGELSIAVERAAAKRKLSLEREIFKARLVKSARRLKAILSSTGDAIIAANDKDEIVLASPEALRLLGKGILNDNSTKDDLPLALADTVKRWRELDETSLASVEVPWPRGMIHLARISPILSQSGEITGWVMILRDVTYQKRLETFIVRHFAAVASKIRQPMEEAGVVMTNLEASLNSGEGDPIEQVRKLRSLFEKAHEGSDELLSLKDNGAMPVESSELISLTDFLDKKESTLGSDLQSGKMVKLEWNVAEKLPEIDLELGSMAQIFHHLLQRAALRSREGDVVRISADGKGNRVWLEVTDPGTIIGELETMPDTDLAIENTSELMERSEIELAVAKSYVKQIGGQLWMRRTEGGGAAVAICLPKQD